MAVTINGTTGIDTPSLTADTTTLVVDETNNRVGIGTASPSSQIHLNESGSANAVQRIQAATNGYAAQLHLYGNSAGGAAYNSIASYVNGDATPQWEITGPEALAEDQMLFHTGGTERMRIDAAGRVTMPYQPVFSVFDASDNETTWTSGTTEKIIFNNTPLVNIGSHYSTTNSRFTAPVDGVYYFEATVGLYIGYPEYVRDFAMFIRKNDVTIAQMEVQINRTDAGSSNAHGGIHLSTYTEASSGDYFEIKAIPYSISGGTLRAYTRVFSGRLVG